MFVDHRAMSSGALILDQTWHQAAVFFAMIAVAIAACFKKQYEGNPLVIFVAPLTCAVFLWLGVSALTWSARIDEAGVAIHAPVGILQRSTFISWDEMAAAEIIPCGWNVQGLHLVSRQGAEIMLPLDQIPRAELASVIGRVTAHRSVRIAPDIQTFQAQASRIVPSSEHLFRLRVRAARERLASAAR
jgi:hypothetical protein